MADSLLTIVQKACGRLGVVKPATVVGSPVLIAAQMLDLALEEGSDLLAAHDWSALTVEGATIVLVAGQESYPLPADCDRVVFGTQWDRTNRWMTLGPDNAQTARTRRESIENNGPRRAVRQVGNAVTVWPVPTTSGDVLAYDYVSSSWAASSAGAAQAAFLADTDVPRLPSDLFVLGLKWRFMFAKGLDAEALKADHDRRLAMFISRDKGGGRVLSMSGGCQDDGNADGIVPAPAVTLPTA